MGEKNLSEFQENVLYYISGYIIRSLIETSTCDDCVAIFLYRDQENLTDHDYSSSAEYYKKFTSFVSRGGLLHASNIVYNIVNFLEKQFRSMVNEGELLKKGLNVKKKLVNRAIEYFSEKINLFVPIHPMNHEFLAEELHEIQIVRKVTNIFLKCRMHHYSSLVNNEIHGKSSSIRQKMTKLILFKNC